VGKPWPPVTRTETRPLDPVEIVLRAHEQAGSHVEHCLLNVAQYLECGEAKYRRLWRPSWSISTVDELLEGDRPPLAYATDELLDDMDEGREG
jgi:hypothetical protein